MPRTWLRVTLASLGVLALAACSGATAGVPPPVSVALTPTITISLPASPLTEEQKILHVLNRLGYGPRPGDVEQVKAMGLIAYLQQQLYPEAIPDQAVEQKLKNLTTLTMTSAELMKEFPQPDS